MKLSHILKALLATGTVAFASHSALAQEQFLGEIKLVAFNFPPQGFLTCDGTLLPINQETALFSLLGTQYGGNGTSNFAIPDLRGRVAVGSGTGPGLTQRVQGEVGGQETFTLTVAQLPAHSHPIVASTAEALGSVPTNAIMAGKARVPLYNSIATADTTMAPTASTGGNQAVNQMQPYLVLNYVIALEGIFPSRN